MSIDKQKWRLHQYAQAVETGKGFEVDSQAMVKYPTECQICGKHLEVWAHNEFEGLQVVADQKQTISSGVQADPTVKQVNDKVADSLEFVLKMASCQPCYTARNYYIKQRDFMSELMSHAAIKYNRNQKGFTLEQEKQEKLFKEIENGVKRYVGALRMLARATKDIFHKDMVRPFIMRPLAWSFYLNLLDQKCYTRQRWQEDQNFWIAHVNKISNRQPQHELFA